MGEASIADGVELCPFLRNIHEPTVFSLSRFSSFPSFQFPSLVKGGRGPIFEDGPHFETTFKLFHGRDGVIPLSENKTFQRQTYNLNSSQMEASPATKDLQSSQTSCPVLPNSNFHPFASSAASISLSSFGAFGPFSFDAFMGKGKGPGGGKHSKGRGKQPSKRSKSEVNLNAELHEALGSEWLLKGKCPIARSYQAVGGVLPLVAKWLKPPPGMKVKCPPAIVAARAALARTAFAKSLRPQPLPSKVLAIGLIGMAVNVPLGVWREHTKKFSPAWFVAVHASVPFVAMLRKAVHMPQYAMAFTIASAILGQVIGSRAERHRLKTGTTHVVEEFEVLSGQHTAASDLPKAIHMKQTVSMETGLQRDKRQSDKRRSDSLAYQCAKEVWDATSAANSVSVSPVPVGAF